MAEENANGPEPVIEEQYENSDYSNTFFGVLRSLRNNGEYCDFALEVGGEIIHAHRVALGIASPYFAAMFKSNMNENLEGSMKLEWQDLNAVKAIVEYIYSGKITITEENVQETLELIMDDHLSVKFEDNAYKATINWIKHNVDERKVHIPQLLRHIRFPYVRSRLLTEYVINESLLRNDQQCNQFLNETLN
uniref:BTB domain-containing protein n=1 Tax=Glossina austeni TaxID=7395 RepID=A0A1A9UIJ3_GLOAU